MEYVKPRTHYHVLIKKMTIAIELRKAAVDSPRYSGYSSLAN